MDNYAIYPTELGRIKIGYNDKVVTYVKKIIGEADTDEGVRTDLSDKVYTQLKEYFSGKRKEFDIPYELNGTKFQKKVWKALSDIPYGETRTYKEIATAVGNPKASRAVGMANNKNPIPIIVPCHRVIGANGRLVGYFGGLPMKEKLLEIEKNNRLIQKNKNS